MWRMLSCERGQDTVEWAGVVAAVALMIGALLALGVVASLASAVECNVQKVLGGAVSCPAAAAGASGAGLGPPGAAHQPGPGSLPPGKKPGIGFGHCGPDDYVPGALEGATLDYIGGVYVGDICNWHDHCTSWTSYLQSNYNCDVLFLQAMLARCSKAPPPISWNCDVKAEEYFAAVEEARKPGARPGSMPNHGPPPPQVGYPPGVHR
jgi:hypothetical protein